jgi:hypothetical protein
MNAKVLQYLTEIEEKIDSLSKEELKELVRDLRVTEMGAVLENKIIDPSLLDINSPEFLRQT